MPSAEAVIGALTRPGDLARLRQRDRPLHAAARRAAWPGQTFEIEVAAGTDSGRPIFTRGYVTITTLVTPDDPAALRAYFDDARGGPRPLRRGRAARGARGRRAVVGFDLTTHAGPLHGQRATTGSCSTPTRAGRGSAPPGPGTRCRGTSTAPTGSPGARPSTRSGARATSSALSMLHQLARRDRRVSGAAVVVGSGPERARRRDPPRRGRARRAPCSRRPTAPAARCAPRSSRCPGFRHDTFSSVYPAAAASPVFARMPLDAPRPATGCTRRRARRTRCPTASAIALYRDVDATAASLDRRHAGDGERWRAFVAPAARALRRRARDDARRLPARSRGPLRLLGARSARRARCASRGCCPASARRARQAPVRGRRARAPGSTAPRCTATRRRPAPGSAIAAVYLNLLGHAVGWPSPRGRRRAAHRRARRLPARARRRGAHRRASSSACIVAARPRDRRRGSPAARRVAADVVVADVMPHALVAHGRRRPARLVPAPAAPLPLRPGDASRSTGRSTARSRGRTPEVARRRDGARRRRRGRAAARRCSAGRATACPSGRSCCSASRASPTRRARRRASTPPGPTRTARSTASTGQASPTRTSSASRRRSSASRPASATASSPATCSARPTSRRRNANLVGGDVGGGSYRLDQVVFRPCPSLSPYRTPLDGLYLGSAATFPGGAVHGVPGDAAARAALADARRRR